VASFGVPANKVIRTEKVGSGGYSNLVKKQLRTGFPQLDAYGEARKEVAWKAIEGYYRRQKAERKKLGDIGDAPADCAARDAVRCLEHAMVIVAGEKTVFKAILAPSTANCEDEDAPFVAPFYQKGCVTAFSHVAAGVVDRTMDIIETVFLKEGCIGQSSKEATLLSINDAAAGAAAGLRMLDGIRILGPSLAKLCDIPVIEKATVNVKPGTMPIASTLCIAIHRTTVKNTARTLENLAKAIQEDPLDGEAHRPADAGVCSASFDIVKAIRLISPFLNAYKSVTKRRALPWDPNIGDEAGEMDSFVKYLIMRLRNSLVEKAGHYALEPGPLPEAKSHMFMINNTYYLLRQLRPKSSKNQAAVKDESEHYRIEGSWFENDVKKVFDAERLKYLALWEPLNNHTIMLDEKGNNISNEGSRLLKTRFTAFNEDFERIHALHMELSVVDTSLRKNMQNEVKGAFFPNYQKFYEKYSAVRFSKKKQEEYLKFPPRRVEEMIGMLFEVSDKNKAARSRSIEM
jgi:exocyst complex protein 7